LFEERMKDRRQLLRWHINKETNVRLEGQDRPFLCIVEDINIKGLKIYSRQQFAQQKDLSMYVDFGQDFAFDVKADIAWRRSLGAGYVYGLYFTRIKDADKERLNRLIFNCCSQQIKEHRWNVSI